MNGPFSVINIAPEFYEICALFTDIKKFTISLESLYFLTFYAKGCDAKFE